jgi:hypothetical protein
VPLNTRITQGRGAAKPVPQGARRTNAGRTQQFADWYHEGLARTMTQPGG